MCIDAAQKAGHSWLPENCPGMICPYVVVPYNNEDVGGPGPVGGGGGGVPPCRLSIL